MSNRGLRFPAEPLDQDEIVALLDAAAAGFLGERDVAAIVLMWRGGLRCAETLSLRRRDIRVVGDGLTATVLRPKGAERERGRARPRVVGLGPVSAGRLKPWLELHEQRWNDDTHLICTAQGGRMDTSHWRRAIPRWARQAGISRRVHPHALRHTFAFECVMEQRPLPWISKALGHTSLLTTQTYLNHLAPADVLAGMMERD